MRVNAALTSALVSSATLMGYAHAEDAEPKADASSVAEKPTFTVCVGWNPPANCLDGLRLGFSTIADLVPPSRPR